MLQWDSRTVLLRLEWIAEIRAAPRRDTLINLHEAKTCGLRWRACERHCKVPLCTSFSALPFLKVLVCFKGARESLSCAPGMFADICLHLILLVFTASREGNTSVSLELVCICAGLCGWRWWSFATETWDYVFIPIMVLMLDCRPEEASQ